MATNKNRCWPGYTPVPGKRKNEQGSCRPKAESKMGPSEKEFRAERKNQLDEWAKKHPGKSRSGARHVQPATKKASAKSRSKKTKTISGAKKTAPKAA